MSKDYSAKIVGLAGVDPVFSRLRIEAEELIRREPEFTGFIYATILNQESLASAVAHRVA
ncbi:MAG: serine O-acetyltransferase, partial [Beijerinckiaceae bacterium]